MEFKHTELPWSCRDRAAEDAPMSADGSDRFIIECDIRNIPGIKGVVATCGYRLNAELIVTACNNHYQLVESLEETLKCLENWMDLADNEDQRDYDYDAAKKAKSMLEKIKQ